MAELTKERVLELLSNIDLKKISETDRDFSSPYVTYHYQLRAGDGTLVIPVKVNLDHLKTPDIVDVMRAVAADAAVAAKYKTLDDFFVALYDQEGRTGSIQKVVDAYDMCKKERAFLNEYMGIPSKDLYDFAEVLENGADDLRHSYQERIRQKQAQERYDNPPVPDGWYSMKDLCADLECGDFGDRFVEYDGDVYVGDMISYIADDSVDIFYRSAIEWLSENYEWLEEADAAGLLEGCKGDLGKMAQYEAFSQDLYDHLDDSMKYAIYQYLAGKDIYAISPELSAFVDEFSFDSNSYLKAFLKRDKVITRCLTIWLRNTTGYIQRRSLTLRHMCCATLFARVLLTQV